MHYILDLFRVFFGLFCWIFVWCLAFWRGRRPERIAAAVTLALGIFSMAVPMKEAGGAFAWPSFVTDSLLFLLFLFLSLRRDRIWPVPAAGFQLIAVLTHFAALIQKPTSTWAYTSVSVLATWLVLIAFAIGLWENELRRKMERAAGLTIAPQTPTHSQRG